MEDRGLEVFTFHRTMSFGNWPFLVLVLILAGVASTPLLLDGNWFAVALVAGAVLAMPFMVFVLQYFPELLGERVLVGVYAKGIVWSRLWMRDFIPWSNLEQAAADPRGLTRFTERRGRNGGPIGLPNGSEAGPALAFIAERLPKQ